MTRSSSVNADGVFEPFRIAEVPWHEVARGERFAMRFQVLSDFGGGSQISVAMEILPPGKQANQLHYHLLEEEHVLVLEGSMTVRLGEARHVVEAGHYVCFPAGQRVGHALINHTDQPCRYVVLGNPHKHDVAVFPETGRVSVKLAGEAYRATPNPGYWDGVDADAPPR
jgi:uncharacterized cupin superfamily protein